MLHGHRMSYLEAGADSGGPGVLLLHGLADSAVTWRRVLPLLADGFHVIAPDLLGHGESAKPMTDYSMGALASNVRDLLLAIGFERATIVGHSLGGGVAMTYVYQFPENVDRMVLVSSGGLGREVAFPLRLAALPGIPAVLAAAASPSARKVGGGVLRACRLERHPAARTAKRQLTVLSDPAARAALMRTLRGVMDLRGQRMSAADRLYLAQDLPVLFTVSGGDRLIPADHTVRAHELVPGSRLEVFEGSSHYPQLSAPQPFADVLRDFITTTQPRQLGGQLFRDRLLEGPGAMVPHQPSAPDVPASRVSGAGGPP